MLLKISGDFGPSIGDETFDIRRLDEYDVSYGLLSSIGTIEGRFLTYEGGEESLHLVLVGVVVVE